ncbi:hypothetical protein HDU79_003711 [Rhizoclosmatium sp. JEL0117]|nr:hypothetical protein HDU79_003711 [Rhizoclosmatium sp. JEL0117]
MDPDTTLSSSEILSDLLATESSQCYSYLCRQGHEGGCYSYDHANKINEITLREEETTPAPKVITHAPTFYEVPQEKQDKSPLPNPSPNPNDATNDFLSQLLKQGETQSSLLATLLTTVSSISYRLENVERKVALVEAKVDAAAVASNSVQSIALNGIAQRLEGLSALISVPTGTTSATTTAAPVDTAPFEAIADRLERLSSISHQPQPPPQSQSPDPTLAMAHIQTLLETMQSRLDSIDKSSSTLAEKVPSPVLERLEQILVHQQLLATQLSATSSASPTPTQPDSLTHAGTAELLEKLQDLDTKIESLPYIYTHTFTTSLQRQTNSLMGIMDDIIKEQTETIKAVAESGQRSVFGAGTTGEVVLEKLGGVVSGVTSRVPDMGIKKRFSRLAGGVALPFGLGGGSGKGSPLPGNVETHDDEELAVEEELGADALDGLGNKKPIASSKLGKVGDEDLC